MSDEQHAAPKQGSTLKTVLLTLLGILAVVVIGFVAVVSMQPKDFRIERQTVIAAPSATVFPLVNDFRNWAAWSPWAKLDPDMKTTYEGPVAGTGAVYSWLGNDQVGEGRMTILESRPDELVKIKLEFLKPFAATNTAEFSFKPEGEQTAVTWSMYGENNFMMKAVHMFMDMDKMLGKEFEKGLADMKAAAEAPKKE